MKQPLQLEDGLRKIWEVDLRSGETLAQRVLEDGCLLRLKRSRLSKEAAKLLERPAGQVQLQLQCFSHYAAYQTDPGASWHLAEGMYRQMYQAIDDRFDFEGVSRGIHGIRSSEAAERLEQRMKYHPLWWLVPDGGNQ